MRDRIVLLGFLVVAGLFLTCRVYAQSTTLNIATPPEGSLTAEQLHAVVVDIRRLEANPLASDAKEARSALMKWAIGSPDFSVSMCTGVINGLVTSKSTYHAELLVTFVLSSAAYIIEHPDQAEKNVEVNVGGLEGTMRTYRALKEKAGKEAKDDFMEKLLKLEKDGKLKDHVSDAVKECNEEGEEESGE